LVQTEQPTASAGPVFCWWYLGRLTDWERHGFSGATSAVGVVVAAAADFDVVGAVGALPSVSSSGSSISA